MPASIASETDLTQQVEIKARWLACSESLCVPQRKTLSVDAKQLLDHKRWKAKFSGWRDSLERDQRSSRLITAVKQEGNLNSGVVQLYIDFAEPSSGVEWFPGPSEELETSNVKTSHNGHKVQVAFDVRVLDGQSSTKSYSEGLLIVKTGAGKRIGVRIQYDL